MIDRLRGGAGEAVGDAVKVPGDIDVVVDAERAAPARLITVSFPKRMPGVIDKLGRAIGASLLGSRPPLHWAPAALCSKGLGVASRLMVAWDTP